jgi:uncharacterized protein with HEPN domain
MRDAVIHHYFGVDIEVVWRVVEIEAPSLLVVVEKLIEDLGASTW